MSLLASLVLSFTLVPVLFKYLLRQQVEGHNTQRHSTKNPILYVHYAFNSAFEKFRATYRARFGVGRRKAAARHRILRRLDRLFLHAFTQLGMDFFPSVDAGQMRLHVRTPPGTRIEDTRQQFARVEGAIREIVGNNQIDVLLDNIGLPTAASISP